MEIQNNDLEQLYAGTFKGIEVGTVLMGKVVSKRSDSIIVDIGYKSEGFVSTDEFTKEELEEIEPGSEIEVLVSSIRDSEGTVTLSKRRANQLKAQKMIQQSFKDNTLIEGTVTEKTKGGFFVDIYGVKAFLPSSQSDVKPVKNSNDIIGQSSQFKVLKINNKLNNVIVSKRVVLEEEKKKKKEEVLSILQEGILIKGSVKNVTDYGVFIDLGEVDGLLHISDISWGRINHPKEYFKVGDEIEVIILKFDAENEKVTLGYKQKNPDPWLNVEEKYPVDLRIKGKVVSLTDYGAFVELEEGVEGLVHISEIDWNPKPKHPSKYIEIGDTVETVVLKVDAKERRISLGLKQLLPKPWEVVAEKYKIGQKVSGKIRTITDFGLFVELPEGVDALIHISDISWTKHIKHPSEVFKRGQKIEATVLSLESEKERMSLGIKQLEPDPWQNLIPEKLRMGDEVSCKILRKSEYGIFVEIENSVEGLIYASEVDKADGKEFEAGEEIKAWIIRLDTDQRKIGLSMINTSQ